MKEPILPSPSFCVLPWIHLSTRPNGHLRLCCTANASSANATNDRVHGGEIGVLKNENGKPANLNHTDLLKAWNNDYMKRTRQMMLQGEVPPACTKCFKEEAAGHRSKRNWENRYWAQRLDISQLVRETTAEGEVPAKIYYVDLRFGTKCNLKCIMCSPHDSSMWVSDWHKLYPQIQSEDLRYNMQWNNKGRVDGASYNWYKENPEFSRQLFDQLPHIQQLYFAGGESTIIEEHYELLEEAIRRGFAKGIELRYNSNGVEMPDRLFNLWQEFRRVRFHFSLDSFGARNEYIRFPSQWSQSVAQLRRLDETPANIEVTLACAVQALNIYTLPEFIEWKLDQGFKKINPWPFTAGMINFHLVYYPAHLNVKVLPTWMKARVRDHFEAGISRLERRFAGNKDFLEHPEGLPRLRGLVRFMESEDWSVRVPQLQEYLRLMDGIRGTNFAETFPELAELMSPPTARAELRP